MRFSVSCIISAVLFAGATHAATLVSRPPITFPIAGTVWPAGSVQTITWDPSNLDDTEKNQSGVILLGQLIDGQDSENIIIDHPLATGFLLTSGSTTITVPNKPTGDNYIIALFGDSGDISAKFTITAAHLLY